MEFIRIANYEHAIYEDIDARKNNKIYDKENDIIQIEIKEDIMKKRLMCIQVEMIKNLFYADLNNIKDFHDITEERRKEIIVIADFLKEVYNKNKMGEDYFYKLLLRIYSSNLGLSNRKEKVILILEIFDPDFEQYRKYSEIYNIYRDNINKNLTNEDEKNIIEIIKDIYGEMAAKLISIEKLYIQEYEIDKFSFIKKPEK